VVSGCIVVPTSPASTPFRKPTVHGSSSWAGSLAVCLLTVVTGRPRVTLSSFHARIARSVASSCSLFFLVLTEP
jgi:hypothetical protein